MKTFCLATLMLFSQSILANIEIYQDTDNTGQNKLERIGIIEKYLINLSVNLKNMDAKLEDNTKKLGALEKAIAELKESDSKRVQTALGEKRQDPEAATAEIEKLKADFLTIKNDDIERLKQQMQALSNTLKELGRDR